MLIIGAVALGALLLLRKQSSGTDGGGGGGIPSATPQLFPFQTGTGTPAGFSLMLNLPPSATSPTGSQYVPVGSQNILNQQLLAQGATPAAVQNLFGGYAGSNYFVSSQGGIVKTLSQFKGFESVSPLGRAYSTASPTAAMSIATGGSANPPKQLGYYQIGSGFITYGGGKKW
jgi:hypothetical protein